MQYVGMLIQVLLIVSWYTVPAMATVPAWAIFLPLILSGIGLVFVLLRDHLLAGLISLLVNR